MHFQEFPAIPPNISKFFCMKQRSATNWRSEDWWMATLQNNTIRRKKLATIVSSWKTKHDPSSSENMTAFFSLMKGCITFFDPKQFFEFLASGGVILQMFINRYFEYSCMQVMNTIYLIFYRKHTLVHMKSACHIKFL